MKAFTSLAAVGLLAGIARSDVLTGHSVLNNDVHPWTTSMMTTVPFASHTISQWPWGRVPIECLQTALADPDTTCTRYNIEVYDVTYSDCPVPWIVCRCSTLPTSTFSINKIAEDIGAVPVRARSFVRHFQYYAVQDQGIGAYANSYDVAFKGSMPDDPGLIHEVAHNLDVWAVGSGHNSWSDSGTLGGQTWAQITAQDTCVPSAYSKAAYGEAFAEWALSAFYTLNVGTIPYPHSCMSHGLAAVETLLRPTLKYNSTLQCINRIVPSTTICMGPDARNAGVCTGLLDDDYPGLMMKRDVTNTSSPQEPDNLLSSRSDNAENLSPFMRRTVVKDAREEKLTERHFKA